MCCHRLTPSEVNQTYDDDKFSQNDISVSFSRSTVPEMEKCPTLKLKNCRLLLCLLISPMAKTGPKQQKSPTFVEKLRHVLYRQ